VPTTRSNTPPARTRAQKKRRAAAPAKRAKQSKKTPKTKAARANADTSTLSAAAAEAQLEGFIARYTPEIAALARTARAHLRARLHGSVEMAYDNYNALAVGYGPNERASSAFISIALFPRWINLFFLYGATLPDPEGLLEGDGSRVRHIRLRDATTLEQPAVQALIDHALVQTEPLDRTRETRLVIKSISAKQRPRRP
jgi:hypothetical protein